MSVGLREQAGTLDPDVLRAVDHDLRDRWIGEQPFERPVAEDVVRDLGREPLAVITREPRLLTELVADLGLDAVANRSAVFHVEEARPELADEREMDPVLELGEGIASVAVRRDNRCSRRESSQCARAAPSLDRRLPQRQPPPPVAMRSGGHGSRGGLGRRGVAARYRCASAAVRPGRLRPRLGHDDRLPVRERTRESRGHCRRERRVRARAAARRLPE